MKLKLFPKIALILISLATIPVIVVGWRTAQLNKVYLEDTILELHTDLAKSLSMRISGAIREIEGKARASIELLRMQGLISTDSLQVILNSDPEFLTISYVSLQGREMIKASRETSPEEKKPKDLSDDPVFVSYLSQAMHKDEKIRRKYGFYFEKGDPRLSLMLPMDPSNFSRGAFHAVVSLSVLWNEISGEGAGIQSGGREAFIVDEDGMVLAHSANPVLALKRVSFAKNPLVAEALQVQTIGSKEYKDESGRSMIGSYFPVQETGWISVIQQPRDTAYAPVLETRRSALEIMIISILAASLVAFFFARNISKPIFSLIEGAKRVARGEFNHSVSVKTNDEISDLASTFNEMIKELKRYSDLQVDRIIEEKTKTESVIYSIADGIIMTDEAGTIQLANDHFLKIFSLNASKSPESLIGKNLHELIQDNKINDAFLDLVSKPEERLVREITLSQDSYEQHYQLSSEQVMVPKSQNKLGVVTVVHDVTLERQMDQMKEGFLHSITHDLRNPMTSIIGFLKFLLDGTAGPLSDQQKQMLETMDRASARLLSMINDILDVAKIEAGKFEIELSPIAVGAMIEDVRSLYQPLAKKKSIRLEAVFPQDASDSKLLTIQGDPNLLERVIGNLVANAVKFTPSQGCITIRLEVLEDRVQISVSDTGPGIPEDYREKVFDKFQQVKGQKRGGTGLGLTICKYFIELHKGKIWVESEAGNGSKFIFWIPRNLELPARGEAVPFLGKTS